MEAQMQPLSQEFPSIEFPEGGLSFSQILVSDGNQSDVDGNKLMQNLDRGGHLEQLSNLLTPTYDTGPGPTSVEPALGDFAGNMEFDIGANSLCQEKNNVNWVCSNQLKKLFIKMDARLTLQFCWKHVSVTPFFIRATAVYTSPDFVKTAVERCPTHRQADIDANGDSPIVDHVLRCENVKAIYEKNVKSGRYSVKVPVKASDSNFEVDYYFTCQTSCASGMERRPIQVLFTMEDATGNVCGRIIWGFKICACPKRDMRKELVDEDWAEDVASHDGKKRIQETQNKALSPDDKLDKCLSDLLDAIPEEVSAIKALWFGRFWQNANSKDPKVKAAHMNLLPL